MRYLSRILQIATLVLGLGCTSLIAQKATLAGKVTDQSGNPIPEVQIAIKGVAGDPAVSDKSGSYTLSIPANKELEVYFLNLGYFNFSQKITAKAGETIHIDPILKFRNNMDTINVSTEDRTNEMPRIDVSHAFQFSGPSTDISKLLLSQGLGVQSSNELSSSYAVRGGNYDENLMYINDMEVFRPLLARSGQQEGLSFPNPDMISSMNFSSGGFEAKYGDKMSSALDVQYRKPRNFAATVSGGLLGGSVHVQDVTKNKFFSWQIGGRYRTTQYLLNSLDTKGQYKPTFFDFQSTLNFDFSEKFNVEVLTCITGNKYLVVPTDRTTTFGTFSQAMQLQVYYDGQEISKYNTYFSGISATYRPRKNLKLKFISTAYRDFENETFTVQGQYFINQLNSNYGSTGFGNVAFNRGVGTYINSGRNYLDATIFNAEHKGTWTIRDTKKSQIQVLWGVRVQHEIIHDVLGEWNYLDSAGYSVPQTGPQNLGFSYAVSTSNDIQSNKLMEYAEYIHNYTLKDTSKLTFTGGVRANYWTFNHQNVTSPRFTLAYEPNWKRDWVFRASYGYYYQVPFYREMRDFYGNVNQNIKAQQSIHYVLSSDLNFKIWNRPFKFVNALYYKQLNQLIPYDVDDVRIRYFANNNDHGYATGADFRLNGEFIPGTESWISLSVMQTREQLTNLHYATYTDASGNAWYPGVSVTPVHDSVIHTTTNYIPRPSDQLVTVNMFFQDHLPRLPKCKLNLSVIYGSGLPVTPPNHEKWFMSNNFRFPSYKRVDLGFSYELIGEDKPLPKSNRFNFIKSAFISLEVWNLLGINNTVSYTWLRDVTNQTYAIPNYLTYRMVNLKLQLKF